MYMVCLLNREFFSTFHRPCTYFLPKISQEMKSSIDYVLLFENFPRKEEKSAEVLVIMSLKNNNEICANFPSIAYLHAFENFPRDGKGAKICKLFHAKVTVNFSRFPTDPRFLSKN